MPSVDNLFNISLLSIAPDEWDVTIHGQPGPDRSNINFDYPYPNSYTQGELQGRSDVTLRLYGNAKSVIAQARMWMLHQMGVQ